ncbi:MAG TPA: 50S ribosomal protein L24 [Candidatus Nanoarchaeia archaeon]|nr:50S ribosomal protein L24 [uncultured archaeon]
MLKLKVGDQVLITAGKDKGKSGKIERVLPREARVVVTGINLYKRNLKSSGTSKRGGIIDIVKPIAVANVTFTCPKCKLPTRVGYVIKADKKARICKKCDQMVD